MIKFHKRSLIYSINNNQNVIDEPEKIKENKKMTVITKNVNNYQLKNKTSKRGMVSNFYEFLCIFMVMIICNYLCSF